MNRRLWKLFGFGAALASIALAGGWFAGCGGDAPPHVVLITIDTLRADYVGCYGREGAATPVMDGLAARGVRFDQCQAPVPITLPSHASMLTGRVPPLHGIRNNGTYRLPDGVPTLAEELQELGYSTGAFIAALPLSARFGLDRGFDRYDEELPTRSQDMFHFRERPAPDVVRAALSWVDEVGSGDPVFLWAHFFEPHKPYRPPPPYDQRFAGRPYDGEVAAADASVGHLLEGLAQRGIVDPLVIVTSDHGEGLGEHGESTHAMFLYQTTLRVPLVVNWPGKLAPGAVVEETVGLVDIAPTVLDWVGGDPQRLRSDIFAGSVTMGWGIALPQGLDVPARTLYSETLYPLETYHWSPAFALREGPLKVIRSARSVGFDLQRDPDELFDLLSGGQGQGAPEQMLSRADSVVSALAAYTGQLDAGRQMTPEETAALAALGYAGGVPAVTGVRDDDALLRATRELPDATEQIEVFERITQLEEMMMAGQDVEAVQQLEAMREDNPGNTWLMALLAQGLAKVGRVDDAIRTYEQADAERPDWLEIQTNLARLCRAVGRRNEARRYYQRMVELDPANPTVRMEAADALYQMEFLPQAREVLEQGLAAAAGLDDDERLQAHAALARVLLDLGQAPEGRRHLQQALALGAPARVRMIEADYLARQGQWDEAAAAYRPLLDELPDSGELRLQLAVALHQLGNTAEAEELCAAAVERDDRLHLAHNNLAWYLAQRGDPEGIALAHALRAVELAPDRVEYADTLIEVLVQSGREDEARAALREALARFPDKDSLRQRARDLGVTGP